MISINYLFESKNNKITNKIFVQEDEITCIAFRLDEKWSDPVEGKTAAYAGEIPVLLKDMEIGKEYSFNLGIHQHAWEWWNMSSGHKDPTIKYGTYSGIGKLSSDWKTNDFTFTSNVLPGEYRIFTKIKGIFGFTREMIVRLK